MSMVQVDTIPVKGTRNIVICKSCNRPGILGEDAVAEWKVYMPGLLQGRL